MLEYTFFLRKTRLQLGDASDGEAGGVDARLPGDATGESVGNGLDSEGFLMAMLSDMRRASSCEARNSPLRRRSIAAVTCSSEGTEISVTNFGDLNCFRPLSGCGPATTSSQSLSRKTMLMIIYDDDDVISVKCVNFCRFLYTTNSLRQKTEEWNELLLLNRFSCRGQRK
jgi:hypothetical protein